MNVIYFTFNRTFTLSSQVVCFFLFLTDVISWFTRNLFQGLFCFSNWKKCNWFGYQFFLSLNLDFSKKKKNNNEIWYNCEKNQCNCYYQYLGHSNGIGNWMRQSDEKKQLFLVKWGHSLCNVQISPESPNSSLNILIRILYSLTKFSLFIFLFKFGIVILLIMCVRLGCRC